METLINMLFGTGAQAAPAQAAATAPAASGGLIGGILRSILSPFTLMLGVAGWGAWRMGWGDSFLPAGWKSTETDMVGRALPDPDAERVIGTATGLQAAERTQLLEIYAKLKAAGKLSGDPQTQFNALLAHYRKDGDQITGADKADTVRLLQAVATSLRTAGVAETADSYKFIIGEATRINGGVLPGR